MIEFKKGDIFEEPVQALVNPVNCVGIMGSGLAKKFKERFPENFEAYDKLCEEEKMCVGVCFVFDRGDKHKLHRYIINMPTKKHWVHPSERSYIVDGLSDLYTNIGKYKIQSLAIPAIGCGHGGLPWDTVKVMIEKRLSTIFCDIKVFEPH